jgi:hypothetical protein
MMKNKQRLAIGLATLALSALVATVISAQDKDKYNVKVPGGLAFSEFKGYEAWATIAISQNGPVMAVILGNPAMIEAYQAGIPGNGKPFPDGAKMEPLCAPQRLRAVAYTSIHETFVQPAVPCPPPGMRST